MKSDLMYCAATSFSFNFDLLKSYGVGTCIRLKN